MAAADRWLDVDEFIARSPDEISLQKADRIELIEKDDDFGGKIGIIPRYRSNPD